LPLINKNTPFLINLYFRVEFGLKLEKEYVYHVEVEDIFYINFELKSKILVRMRKKYM